MNLVVYYSRTGHTKTVAETISDMLACDIEEIVDTEKRSGIVGFLRSGREVMKKELTILEGLKKDVSEYDLVIIGTPVWVLTMSTPVRTFILQNKDYFKKVAFFCTYGGMGAEATFAKMEALCGKKPVSVLSLRFRSIKKDDYIQKVKKFVNNIDSS